MELNFSVEMHVPSCWLSSVLSDYANITCFKLGSSTYIAIFTVNFYIFSILQVYLVGFLKLSCTDPKLVSEKILVSLTLIKINIRENKIPICSQNYFIFILNT